MKNIFKYILSIFIVLVAFNRCADNTYTMGDLTAPTDLVINTEIVGTTTAKPNGDGSGDVKINIAATGALGYKVGYNVGSATTDLVYAPSNSFTKKFTSLGLNTYRITVVVFGKGGTSSTLTKDVTVQFDYVPAAAIVTNLTGGSSKTWVVDPSVPGHLGVGPWDNTSVTPSWWSAGVNEKVATANCFYTSTFKFSKDATTGAFSLQVTNPDGAFTKTGSLTSLPGIPAAGAEGCYTYGGGTSAFSFLPASTKLAASTPSTQVSIALSGVNTYIGYGATLKEYEIMVLTPTYMYLRVQGTETGNAWYIKLKAI